MKKLKTGLLCVLAVLSLAACNQTGEDSGQSEVLDNPGPGAQLEISAEEVVREALDRGARATRYVYMAEFPQAGEGVDGFYALDYDFLPVDGGMELELEVMQDLHSVADVKDYMYRTFDDTVAGVILDWMFNDRYEMYRDIDGQLYENGGVSIQPLDCYVWDIDTLEIVSANEGQIVAKMTATNGHQDETYPDQELVLIYEEGQWLLTGTYFRTLRINTNE